MKGLQVKYLRFCFRILNVLAATEADECLIQSMSLSLSKRFEPIVSTVALKQQAIRHAVWNTFQQTARTDM